MSDRRGKLQISNWRQRIQLTDILQADALLGRAQLLFKVKTLQLDIGTMGNMSTTRRRMQQGALKHLTSSSPSSPATKPFRV